MTQQDRSNLVEIYAAAYQLRPKLVAAVILQESEGHPDACRFDEKSQVFLRLFSWDRSKLAGWKPLPGQNPSLHDEKIWRGHSWGWMQILGETARVLGFTGKYLPALIHPENSLEWGCKYLRKCMDKASLTQAVSDKLSVEQRGLLFYNGGGDPNYPFKVLDRIASGQVDEQFPGLEESGK